MKSDLHSYLKNIVCEDRSWMPTNKQTEQKQNDARLSTTSKLVMMGQKK